MNGLTYKPLSLLSTFILLMSAFSLSANEHAYRALSFVTGFVKAGQKNEIQLEITDRMDEIGSPAKPCV